jgi:hypothetical protein
MAAAWRSAHAGHVPGDNELLARLLTLTALIAGTMQYVELMARRVAERRRRADVALAQDAGLRGLVRIALIDRG